MSRKGIGNKGVYKDSELLTKLDEIEFHPPRVLQCFKKLFHNLANTRNNLLVLIEGPFYLR